MKEENSNQNEATSVTAELIHNEPTPQSMISTAIDKGMDISKLERLFDLQERWEKTNARKSFLQAMSDFQKNVPVLEKKKQVAYTNKAGSRTSYKYAELGEISQSIKDTLTQFGLSYRWEFQDGEKNLVCTCIVSHIDGHSERTTMTGSADTSGGKNDIQGRASAITYLQRYTLIGALGLTTCAEDNDSDQPDTAPSNGKAAPQPEQKKEAPIDTVNVSTRPPAKPKLSDSGFQQAMKLIAGGDLTMYQNLVDKRDLTDVQKNELSKAHDFAKALATEIKP